MKIGLITDNIDEGSTGIGSYARNLCKALFTHKNSQEYVCFHYKKNSFYKTTQDIIIPRKKNVFHELLRRFFLLPRAINHQRVDILHDTYHFIPPFISKRTKKVITIHDIYSLLHPKNHRAISTLAHKFLLGFNIKTADALIAVSENTKKDLVSYYKISPEKIHVIYESVDEDYKPIHSKKILSNVRSKYNLPSEFILHVGTLEPRKNIPFLLRSYANVRGKINNIPIVLVGKKGWKYQEIYQTIEKLKLTEHILFPGYIDREDLPAIYASATVLVYPSLYEGFGLPPLEAMSCGTPVITSSSSSIPEVVGKAAILIDPTNQEDMEQAIVAVITNKILRKKLIEKGMQQVKKFTWEKTAKKTFAVYESICR